MDITDILFRLDIIGIIFFVGVELILYLLSTYRDHKRKRSCKDCYYYMPGSRYDSPGRCAHFLGSPAFEGKHECECFIEKEE